jgi:hypothetical protein
LRETQTIISRMELGEVKRAAGFGCRAERHENNIRMIKFLAQRHVAEDPGMFSGRRPGAMVDA